jgi:hypothetical protein
MPQVDGGALGAAPSALEMPAGSRRYENAQAELALKPRKVWHPRNGPTRNTGGWGTRKTNTKSRSLGRRDDLVMTPSF